jgi:hypothetical protein
VRRVVDEEPAAPELEEGAELAPADLIVQREAELQHIQQRIAAGQVAADNAVAALTVERNVLDAVVQVSHGCSKIQPCTSQHCVIVIMTFGKLVLSGVNTRLHTLPNMNSTVLWAWHCSLTQLDST